MTLAILVHRKAFGRTPGLATLATSVAAISVALGLHASIPLMTWLGPLLVLEYLDWRYWCGSERTAWQYLRANNEYRPAPRSRSARLRRRERPVRRALPRRVASATARRCPLLICAVAPM